MTMRMLIDARHREETRVAVVKGNRIEEFDFESSEHKQLKGNIYLAKVTRVEPSLQAAFVDYGGNRHGFLAFSEIHPDYYQIPREDREALLREEREHAEEEAALRADFDDEDEDGEGVEIVEATHHHDDDEDSAPEGDAAEGEASEGGRPNRGRRGKPGDDAAEELRRKRMALRRRYKIQDVIKRRQVLLVQVVKEERGNKGAALTTYLSLAGRYCVLMPNTSHGGGISRKISNAADRKRLKTIIAEMALPSSMGCIVRTAGLQRTKPEIKRDFDYLARLWDEIREKTLQAAAPELIHNDSDLIKRAIRDLYNREIEEVLVEGEGGYRTAKDFMRMIMPAQARVVQRYVDQMPLFARFQVESYLAGMFNPVVQLKSGGYIVIGVTEALVAVDVNSGRATKEGSIEETALKTNLEAADEVARQLRLRDLAGLIVIDFIDMEERRNNAAVEKRLKDKLKTDRARIQVGRISGFGLMEMSRQRLRPGMLESTTQPCPHCHGTGLIRSDDSLALTILRALEEEGTRKRSKEVLLKAPVAVINYLINHKREHIALIEARYGMAVRLEADPALVSPDYSIEKFKTATRLVPEVSAVISGNAALMGAPVEEQDDEIDPPLEEDDAEDEVEAEVVAEAEAEAPAAAADGNGGKKKRRRRSRRRGGKSKEADGSVSGDEADEGGEEADEDEAEGAVAEAEVPEVAVEMAEVAVVSVAVAAEPVAEPVTEAPAEAVVAPAAEVAAEPVAEAVAEAPAKPKRASRAKKAPKAAEPVAEAPEAAPAVEAKPKATRSRSTAARSKAKAKTAAEPAAEAEAAVAVTVETPAAAELPPLQADPGEAATAEVTRPDPAEAGESQPKRKGWWAR
ncbi:MAG TPA: ribonuclease E/G [Gemmobacter sp.]|nr:ribonuclease E/G [Gemmobacter sp.]